MTIVQFLILLFVAGVCGSIAQSLVGYSTGGCLVSIVLGFIGAVFGMWIARQLGLHEILSIQVGNESFPVLWSIVGAALFAGILSLFSRGRRPRDIV